MIYAGDELYGDDVTSGLPPWDAEEAWSDAEPECPECFSIDVDGGRIKRCATCGYAWDDETGDPVNPSRVEERRAKHGE
jgi:hypothetical protein